MKSRIVTTYKEKIDMYQHLESIRQNLWSNDGKSRVSVMVGSGFSLNAEKIEDDFSEMALWGDLKTKILEKLLHHPGIVDADVLQLGQIYEEEYGRSSLDELLKESIPDNNYEPGSIHSEFLNLPWADVYTTNYDTLLERAKSKIFERKYQVIYDVNDIPNSVAPRIIKLHGSFPANRPFIFTQSDYERYPQQFSPFVNMVQQSIMETTFVLLGFSGDDPNFERWTTWVRNNLGKQMPKIYMIGYQQTQNREQLNAKGITLIDFENVYEKEEQVYKQMFSDLFEYLKYSDRKEKSRWPFVNYSRKNFDFNTLLANRKDYPGWVVMPHDIRKQFVKVISSQGESKIREMDLASFTDQDLNFINEILWCYDKFMIPMDYSTQIKLESIIDNLHVSSHKHYSLLKSLLTQSRLEFDKKKFDKYLRHIENLELNKAESNEVMYEKILFHYAFNNINKVNQLLNEWSIENKDIEWGIKKANVLFKLKRTEEAEKSLKRHLQTLRSLLAIDNDSYKLLSLESVALALLGSIIGNSNYGKKRLEFLETKKCDVNKEFDFVLLSVKPYKNLNGTFKTREFDPGKTKVSTTLSSPPIEILCNSFTVFSIREQYGVNVSDKEQYEQAAENLKNLFPFYSLVHRFLILDIERIEKIFSREYVFEMESRKLELISDILIVSLQKDTISVVKRHIALEIISRLYFAFEKQIKLKIDEMIIIFMKKEKNISSDLNLQKAVKNLLNRITYDKNKVEKQLFIQSLFEVEIETQKRFNDHLIIRDFYDPILPLLDYSYEIGSLTISESLVNELIDSLEANIDRGIYTSTEVDKSIKEACLVRLVMLRNSKSLTLEQLDRFVSILKEADVNSFNSASNILYSSLLRSIINNELGFSEAELEGMVSREIPIVIEIDNNNVEISYGDSDLIDYFFEMEHVFPNYISLIKNKKAKPDDEFYLRWLDQFYVWWKAQSFYLLTEREEDFFMKLNDYIPFIVSFLKNNILSVILKRNLREKDFVELKKIYEEIELQKSHAAILLIPSYERLNVDIAHKHTWLLEQLKQKDSIKVRYSLLAIYEYLHFITRKEISLPYSLFSNGIVDTINYGTGENLKNALDVAADCLKLMPFVFDKNEINNLCKLTFNYYNLIQENKILFSNLDDFETLSRFTKLIFYLYSENKAVESLNPYWDKWRNYIKNHKLPEIRKYQF
ncbi:MULTISPECIES: SIR2 family protein [unclassified Exiguobacterium]|nr:MULTISPECIES: SIR2 family protein [unclassified Exiguobacterium]TCI68024.1 SIR2 family protein [Exiguobacterium sp. IPCI3]TCI77441.1 SIR2 family protein [Exiguobacterium sp. IPCH1]TCI78919.1 SIR2 family protein [Exiguobacterium sp. IPBC4]